MACTDDCRRPTPAQAHCSVCHMTFSGVSNFDDHRGAGVCKTPQILGLVERRGVWGQYGSMDAEAIARRASAGALLAFLQSKQGEK